MWSRVTDSRLLVIMALACMLVLLGVACSSEEEATPTAQPTAVPTAKPTSVPPTAVPTAKPTTPPAPTKCYIVGEETSDCPPRSPHTWQSPTVPPGEYWSFYNYTGAKPTKFYESPMSYQLVKQGKLPPVEERLPDPEDIGVMQGPNGIGEYGGTYRQTCYYLYLGEWIDANWYDRDANGVSWYPQVGKSVEISSDGRVYTLKLRKGLKWSSGDPFTIEDIRFAWEDLNYNAELNPATSPNYLDPVTGNRVRFAVVDDNTYTLSYDTPVWDIFEKRDPRGTYSGGGTMAYFSPSSYMKQFHPKWADATVLAKMISDGGFDNWVQLFNSKNSTSLNTERPCVTAWCPCSASDTQQTSCRNHYYYMVDPEGNQLPYADEATMIKMESREVAVFRGMAGEQDGQTSPFMMAEVPLYVENMVKGDYSIYHWPCTSGSDANINIQQTYNQDPEIGRWIRTAEFRRALSLGMDRDAINEVQFLGIGTPRNLTPHESTPYFPGPEWANLDITRNVAEANSILDSLGLTTKNADGFRMRLDGKGLLELHLNVGGPSQPVPGYEVSELLRDQWADIGIKVSYTEDASWGAHITDGSAYMTIWETAYVANPWSVQHQIVPTNANYFATEIGLNYETKGTKGMGKGVNTAYLPLAPANTYAADTSGNISKLIDLWNQGRAYSMYSPDRVNIGKQMFVIHAQEKYNLGTLGFTGTFRGVFLNRNNMLGQPMTHVRDHTGFAVWLYWFEDGMDNMHHSDNKSKTQTSWSFIGGK